jgi:pantetheine-phosphate adenylyltransferase
MELPANLSAMTRVVCPGSFDPPTFGHLDVIGRAARLFDEVIVAVGRNVAKNAVFTPQERVEMLTEACAEWPQVRVSLFDGLLVDFCTAQGATAIVKGVRTGADYDYELPMAQMNTHLSGVGTVFLPTAPQWSFVSSSLIREVAGLGGDVGAFLPESIAAATVRRVAERKLTNCPSGG